MLNAGSSVGDFLKAASTRRVNPLAVRLLALLGTLVLASALFGVRWSRGSRATPYRTNPPGSPPRRPTTP